MAVTAPSTADDALVGINVTPLVDVTLVLLIIFMVCAKLIASQGIPLDLPKAATASETRRPRSPRSHQDVRASERPLARVSSRIGSFPPSEGAVKRSPRRP